MMNKPNYEIRLAMWQAGVGFRQVGPCLGLNYRTAAYRLDKPLNAEGATRWMAAIAEAKAVKKAGADK